MVRSLKTHLEYQRQSGSEGIARDAAAPIKAVPTVAAAATPVAPAPRVAPPPPPSVTPPAAVAAPPQEMPAGSGHAPAADADLASIRDDLGDCQRCKLCSGRTNIVFGVGNPTPRIMFIGEGPGRDEDLRGEPFVGRAGQLLTQIITNGMKLQREDVYIANIVKCRPPENRNPEPDEIAACRPFLERQIDVVRPRVIVALGLIAAQTLLATKTPISKLRGQWHDYRGIKLMPTLHPAYLLRNPNDKRLVWEDIKMVMTEIGL